MTATFSVWECRFGVSLNSRYASIPLSRFTPTSRSDSRFQPRCRPMKPPWGHPSTRFTTPVIRGRCGVAANPCARRLTRMWVAGDITGLPIPADAATLHDGGSRYLTEAFARFGALAPENRVTRLTEFAEVSGGSTGR